jgi:DnaJ-class molecular chaperone
MTAYNLLEISRNATLSEVVNAYRQQNQHWRLDKFQKFGDPRIIEMANEKFRKIKEAF